MAKRVAPAKNTGGGGFAFEDEVCAWLLACTLVGEPAFGQALGVPDHLDFQTSASGWLLDDILVTTQSGTVRRRVALSVKSNKQLTARRAPQDFVKAIWEQSMHIGSDAFDASSDFMGLLTTPLPGAARASVDGLLAKTNDADPSDSPTCFPSPAGRTSRSGSSSPASSAPRRSGGSATTGLSRRLVS